MFKNLELRLPYHRVLGETSMQFKDAVQIFLNYGFENKTINKNRLNKGTYRKVRETTPTLPSALVQTAMDTSETLKSTTLEKSIKMNSLAVRYDGRTFGFYPDSHTTSLITVQGSIVFPVSHISVIDRYRGEYTNAEPVIDKKNGIFAIVQVDVPEKEVINKQKDIKIIGVDRGIKNMAVLSNNMFFYSRNIREVKGRFHYLKINLQHSITGSAKRKIEERKRLFVRDVNHVISKKIVSLLCDIIALETLEAGKMKRNGKGKNFRRRLESWPPAEMAKFIVYKAKDADKKVKYVKQKHTSQKCSRCGYVSKENGHGSVFRCKNWSFELNADLNASRNIEVPGISEYFTFLSANSCCSMKTKLIGGGNKLQAPKI